MIRAAVANSNDIGVLHARPRFGHQRFRALAPRGVMRRLLVVRGRFHVLILFDEHKPRGIVVLLYEIKARDARLLATIPRILDRRGLERFEAIGLYVTCT